MACWKRLKLRLHLVKIKAGKLNTLMKIKILNNKYKMYIVMISGYETFSKQNNKRNHRKQVNKFECIKYFLISKIVHINYHLKNHNKCVSYIAIL